MKLLDANEALAEAGGADLNVYLARGVELNVDLAPEDNHVILARNDMYSLESGGESFLDWFTSFVNGDDVADIRCQNC